MRDAISNDKLIWWPEREMGYFPVKAAAYDEAYFQHYEGYASTEMGRRITAARIELVSRHYSGDVVDVGIGCGQFVSMHGRATGFDVNPAGQRWLKDRALWCDIYNGHVLAALTFWDVLEHIENIDAAVARAGKFAFLSIPIFDGPEHVLRSKHFKRTEHYWYFTHKGLVRWFDEQGFEMLESNRAEQDLGREDIGSYAFGRRNG